VEDAEDADVDVVEVADEDGAEDVAGDVDEDEADKNGSQSPDWVDWSRRRL